jgi:hypothetical protein
MGAPHPAADCPMLLRQVSGETVTSDLDWFSGAKARCSVSYERLVTQQELARLAL